MKKVDIAKLAQECTSTIQALATSEGEIYAGDSISNATRQAAAESILAAAYVRWEGFLSDLFVGYINRNSSKLGANLAQRIQASVKEKFGDAAAMATTFSLPVHIKAAQARALLDGKDMNVTFKTAKLMCERANAILPPAAAAKFATLTALDCATLDATHKLRDYVSHQSTAAWDAMNTALIDAHLPADLRRATNKISSVGAFLIATPVGGGRRRIVAYLDALAAIPPKLIA